MRGTADLILYDLAVMQRESDGESDGKRSCGQTNAVSEPMFKSPGEARSVPAERAVWSCASARPCTCPRSCVELVGHGSEARHESGAAVEVGSSFRV